MKPGDSVWRAVASQVASALMARLALWGAIGVAVCLACGFVVAALWAVLAEALGGAAASLILAAVFLAVAVGLYALARRDANGRKRRRERRAAEHEARKLEEAFVAAFRIGRRLGRKR